MYHVKSLYENSCWLRDVNHILVIVLYKILAVFHYQLKLTHYYVVFLLFLYQFPDGFLLAGGIIRFDI